jgi:penicillin-binding protein 2
MRAVCTDGTARFPLNLSSVKIAAKTGTAEVGLPDRWHSWLVSYGPYDAPPEDQIVVVVMVEASNTWEWWSTYATAIIYQSIYADQSYEDAVETLGLRYISKPQGRRE